jgi:hypothetical protein
MTVYNIKYWLFFVLGILIIVSCRDEMNIREPSGSDNSIPAAIQNVNVVNRAGKATINYKLPVDQNFLYVKAEYMLNNGEMIKVKSSYYSDSLVVEGFADTLEHEIKLYSVSRREISSDPVSVKVKPLKAPIWFIRKSIEVNNSFGGYQLTAVNTSKEPVAILVMKKNVFGEWEVDNNKSVYTSVDSIKVKISGLDTLVQNFALAVRDRWGNVTDTLFKDVKPFYEVELSSSRFKSFPLPGDPVQQPGASVANMWDGRRGWPVSFTSLAAETLFVPSTVTVDLGISAKLSKVWIGPFKELSNLYYSFTTMKRFEIWGSSSPNLNGTMDESWILLGSYTLKKPSGPGPTETNDDQAAALAGFFWDVDINAPKVQYIRFRCLENFGGSCPQSIDEMKVYGDPR